MDNLTAAEKIFAQEGRFSKITSLTEAQKSLLLRQARVWKLLGIADDVNDANKLFDNLYNLQKAVVTTNANAIASMGSNMKGAFGEIASDVYLTENGFEALHSRKTALTDGWGETGIDGVFKKDGVYYIVEAKYTGYAKLGNTNDGLQMSDPWIKGSNRLVNAVGRTVAREINRLNNYKRILAKVAPDGSISYKELNDLGVEIGDFDPLQ